VQRRAALFSMAGGARSAKFDGTVRPRGSSYQRLASPLKMDNAVAPAVRRACDGPAPQLTPIKFSHLQRVPTTDSLASADAAAAPAGPPKYLPPSLRRVTTDGKPATPSSLSSDQLSSQDLFPTLGSPGPVTPGGGSWAQLQSRFSGAKTPSATSVISASVSRQNSFEALDDDQASVTTSATLNYSTMMRERIKKDHNEMMMREIPETDDPLEMTVDQLERAGWGVLQVPRSGRAWLQEKLAGEVEPEFVEPEDIEEAYFRNGEMWESMDVLRGAMAAYTTPERLLAAMIRPEFMEPLVDSGPASPVSSVPQTPRAGGRVKMADLLDRKRAAMAAALRVAATPTPSSAY
jgi:hypothetical protein